MIDESTVVVEIVKQLLSAYDVAFSLQSHVSRRRELLIRYRQVDLIGEHGRTALTQPHAARGLKIPLLMPLYEIGIDKQVGLIIAAERIRNQLRLHPQFQTGFSGIHAAS